MNLHGDYPNPLEAKIAELAFLTQAGALIPLFDGASDADALFTILCRGVRMYVEAWAEQGTDGSAATFVVDADDTDDPTRIEDPLALVRTLLRLTVEQLEENAEAMFDNPTLGWQP